MPQPTPIKSWRAYYLAQALGFIGGVLTGVQVARYGNAITESWWWHVAAIVIGIGVSELVVFGSRPMWGWV